MELAKISTTLGWSETTVACLIKVNLAEIFMLEVRLQVLSNIRL